MKTVISLPYCESGFISGDSTTNQLTYLYDTFSNSLDSGKKIRVVFCDISKAFDRVWHQGIQLRSTSHVQKASNL